MVELHAVEFLEFRSPDFGSALNKIILNAHFRSSEPPLPTLERSYEDYHLRLAGLPKSKFERKKQWLTINFESKTGCVEYISDMKDAPNQCRAIVVHKDAGIDLFNAFLREILAIMRLVKGIVKSKDKFALAAYLAWIESKESEVPICEKALDEFKEYSTTSRNQRHYRAKWHGNC